jgi:hypothetical protein
MSGFPVWPYILCTTIAMPDKFGLRDETIIGTLFECRRLRYRHFRLRFIVIFSVPADKFLKYNLDTGRAVKYCVLFYTAVLLSTCQLKETSPAQAVSDFQNIGQRGHSQSSISQADCSEIEKPVDLQEKYTSLYARKHICSCTCPKQREAVRVVEYNRQRP